MRDIVTEQRGSFRSASDTVLQTQTFSINAPTGTSLSLGLPFDLFNPTLGTLTAVTFDLDSAVFASNDEAVTASVSFSGNLLSSYTVQSPQALEDYDFTGLSGLVGGLTLGDYTGIGSAVVAATLANPGGFGTVGDWTAEGSFTGLTLTYTYTYDAAVVPVPAAVWLFGSGLLGLIGVSRRQSPN